MCSDTSQARPPPLSVEDSETLSETANKLERLRELTRKYSVSDGCHKDDETEQALESHEVVELQAFVRHKEWIDDKIQFLENLPAIDIFVGVDELPKTHDQITTLPTRAQLEEWVLEHDKIEKETELLDAGDFKKLKTLTKAATQRNLSPEDTDLIEITLTTLFRFDKLLHLLRDRSEQLDLFGTRLTWEEQRALAYSTRNNLISQIQSFLDNRARWKTDVYNNGLPTSNSSASLHSISGGVQPHDPFSRSARFKRSETLSREIVQLSSKISALRHGPVLSSGKALDKLIEDDRRPVPDAMLDEQDRVEEKCEKDLSTVGKFLMTVNLQFQKADEIYAETRKDVATLQALTEEVKKALTELPSRKAEVRFSNRIQVIKERLQSRMTQPLPSTLPFPKHSLFPSQGPFNTELVNTLSGELSDTRSLLAGVESTIHSYRAGCDAWDEAEKLRKDILNLQQEVQVSTDRLRDGFETEDGSGLPPDLNQNSCVEPMRFSAYLASLPALIDHSSQLEGSALKVTKRARLASLHLDKPGITSDFKQNFLNDIEHLEKHTQSMVDSRNGVSAKISILREIRRIWSIMDEMSKNADAITSELREALLRNQWKQQIGGESAPPTPESPRTELPTASATPESINDRLLSLKDGLDQGIRASLLNVRSAVPSSLHDFMCARQLSIERSLLDLQSLHRLLVDVREQKYAMETIREEVHTLEGRIEDSKVQYDDHFDAVIKTAESDSEVFSSTVTQNDGHDDIDARERVLSRNADSVESDVTSLVDSLPTRVPLISRRPSALSGRTSSIVSRATLVNQLAFDPSAVDRSVRNDTNAYSIRLTSGVKSLRQKRSFGAFYRAARDMSRRVVIARREMHVLADQLEQHTKELEELSDAHLENIEDGLAAITVLKDSLEDLERAEADRLRDLNSTIRDDMLRMEAVSGIQEDSVANMVHRARLRTFDELHGQSLRIFDKLKALKVEVTKAEQVELANLAEIARRQKESAEAELREQERRQKEREESERREREMMEHEASFRIQEESTPRRDIQRKSFTIETGQFYAVDKTERDVLTSALLDVFGPDSPSRQAIDKETAELMSLVRSLRKQLKSIGLNSVVRPSGASRHRSSSTSLPQPETAEAMASDFAQLEVETNKLPGSAENMTADTELRSLRLEMEASRELLNRVHQLARLQASIALCDTTFSTFLDYIDGYPNEPSSEAADVVHTVPAGSESPQERLSERMFQAKGIFGDMNEHFAPVADDPRAITEHSRLKQTWEELSEMALEKISGRPSRAPSALSAYNSSSGRNSSASSGINASEVKRSRYNNLSISGRNGLLAPAMPSQRRATSASSAGSGSVKQSKQQSSTRPGFSIPKSTAASTRSVSGPMKQITPTAVSRAASSLFNSTFASRQRTSSVSSNTSTPSTSRPPVSRRRMSSALSDVSRAASPTPSIASSRGTWSKVPRQSFGSFQRASTPERSPRKPRQKYVANPKNKLDVALGDVINNLPVEINVEAVQDTWKDKSGKYWIGGNEPKLCFCRILRSQTVMVRVGGGWTELSKFIKDHFADLFRLLPETPPRPGSASKEQRWISAAGLRNVEGDASLTKSSGSPDSSSRNVPSFAISTPDGTQRTGSPGSSPLTPFQFIRRADANASEISLSSLALSNDLSTSAVSTVSIRPRRRMSSTSSKFAWKP
ncbi:hypothetical protein ACEPAH_5862 [Sanghuangporus vaninii]